MLNLLVFVFFSLGAYAEDSCRDRLERSICHFDSEPVWTLPLRLKLSEGESALDTLRQAFVRVGELPCASPDPEDRAILMAAYDRLPETSKRVLCDVHQVLLLPETTAVWAAVTIVPDPDLFELDSTEEQEADGQILQWGWYQAKGFLLAINRTILKESFHYEVENDRLQTLLYPEETRYGVPQFESPVPFPNLEFVLNHEAGHIFGLANGVVPFDVPLIESRWDSRWFDYTYSIEGSRLKYRVPQPDIAQDFYRSPGAYKAQDLYRLADYFRGNGFVSIYSGYSPLEDFAESYAHYFSPMFQLARGNEVYFSLQEEIERGEWITKKRDFIRALVESPDVRYRASDAGYIMVRLRITKN